MAGGNFTIGKIMKWNLSLLMWD